MKVKNLKTGSVHEYMISGKTFCGLVAKDKFKVVDDSEVVTCEGCMFVEDDDIDPLGVLDDDLPDGAYWAMYEEVYG